MWNSIINVLIIFWSSWYDRNCIKICWNSLRIHITKQSHNLLSRKLPVQLGYDWSRILSMEHILFQYCRSKPCKSCPVLLYILEVKIFKQQRKRINNDKIFSMKIFFDLESARMYDQYNVTKQEDLSFRSFLDSITISDLSTKYSPCLFYTDTTSRELPPLHIKPTLDMTITGPSEDKLSWKSAGRITMNSLLK